jgi:membrane-associated protease RseP (regulator of RpoE activity)
VDLVRSTRLDEEGVPQQITQIGLSPEREVKRYGVLAAVPETGSRIWEMTVGSFKSLGALPAAIPRTVKTIFNGEQRGADSLVSPVGIGQVAADQASEGDFASVLFLLAGVNLFLGIANLLPLLPLDGGHIAILGYEQARSWVARKLHRPDPGRVDLAKVLPVAYFVVIFMSTLFLLGLYADVTNPIQLP